MTLLTLTRPSLLALLPGPSAAWIAPVLPWLAGRSAGWPDHLEDWQLRDLNLTRSFPGPNRPTHFDLP